MWKDEAAEGSRWTLRLKPWLVRSLICSLSSISLPLSPRFFPHPPLPSSHSASISLSFFLSLSLLPLHPSPPLLLPPSLFLSFFLSPSLPPSLYLSPSLFPSLYLFLPASFSLS